MTSIIRNPSVSEARRKLLPTRSKKPIPLREATGATVTHGEVDASIQKTEDKENIKTIVERARLSILNQFKEEAEAARELGRQRGLREGRLTGIEEAKQNFAGEIARLKQIVESLPHVFERNVAGYEDTLAEIAFEAVCKVMGDTAATRDGIMAMIRQATVKITANEQLKIRLHPDDMALLQDSGALAAIFSSNTRIAWVADKAIELGGCMVETAHGDIDARLEIQIKNLAHILAGVRRKNSFQD